MMNTSDMTEAVSRFEDKREIKNLMGKYVQSLTIRRDAALFDDFWSRERGDVSLGVNEGYYVGKIAIRGFYRAREDRIRLSGKIMQGLFPDKLGDKTDAELYGVGVFEQKPLQSGIIRIAGDRKTAKGIWICNGSFADITECGPTARWVWGYFLADFIWENDAWKLWHLQYLEDISCRCGQNWAEEQEPLPELPAFAALKGMRPPEPTIRKRLRTYYSKDRAFTLTPRVPEEYETFSETFSYGPEGDAV